MSSATLFKDTLMLVNVGLKGFNDNVVAAGIDARKVGDRGNPCVAPSRLRQAGEGAPGSPAQVPGEEDRGEERSS